MKYDDASYHSGGNYPQGLSPFQACVHIGMYVGWIIDNELYAEEFSEIFKIEIQRFQAKELTGASIAEMMDYGKLVDDDLNAEGNSFTEYYYDKYVEDYARLLTKGLPSNNHVEDTWENYKKVKEMIDREYKAWKNNPFKAIRRIFAKIYDTTTQQRR